MSSHNEPVNPIGFEAATPDGRPQQPARTGRSTPLWVLPALGALTILAAFIIFWLPGRVAPTTAPPASIATDVAPPTAVSRENSTPEETSPWSDAQLAKLRKEAQYVLAQLLDVQVALEEVGIEKWGQERLASAAAIASAADEQYRERLFVEARHSYEQALIAFQALLDAAPEALREQLDSARQAIEKGERDTAYSALDIAAAIEPGNEELAILRQRADLLGQLMPLLEQALEAESTGDLAKANTLLQQAAAIDPLHMRLKETQQRVETAFAAQRFSEAMSKGYSALAAGNFRRARSEFNTAAGQRPGSKEAASALQEVKDAETGHRLTTLQGRGQTLESLESWQQAVEAYQQALEIDSNVLFARTGLERSKTRARLDEQILSTLSQPLRLADQAVADDGQKLLRQAKLIEPRGPVLDRQIAQLQALLKNANTPIELMLRSDMETEVILLKVARLGRFAQHQLSLRPGVYTAVGSRNGYRDVRHTFTVNHGNTPPPVMIVCAEKI